MTTMSTPYATTAPSYSTSDDDTVRLPLVTTDPRPAEYRALDHRALDTARLTTARSSTPPGCGPVASPPPPSPRSSPWSAPS